MSTTKTKAKTTTAKKAEQKPIGQTPKPSEEIVDLEDGTGLGDKVEALIPNAVKNAVEKVTGGDCGCKKRKEWLNNIHFDFVNTKKGCMTEEQLKSWEAFKKQDNKKLNKEKQTYIIEMYNSVLRTNLKGCSSCAGAVWLGYIQRIDRVFEKVKAEKAKNKKS